jgi:hypothetical protein
LQATLVAGLGGVRLGKLGLKWPRIDLRQHVAGGHVLAFDKVDAVQMTVNAGLYRNDIERMDGADAAQEYRHVLALHPRRPDGDGRCLRPLWGSRGSRLAPRVPTGTSNGDKRQCQHEPRFTRHCQSPFISAPTQCVPKAMRRA